MAEDLLRVPLRPFVEPMLDAGPLHRCLIRTRAANALPIPSWRGIPCRWGHTEIAFRNYIMEDATRPDAWMPFSTLVLLPERDPPGPPARHILLGSQFFLHHSRLRLALRYGDIDYDPATRRPLPFSGCGEIVA